MTRLLVAQQIAGTANIEIMAGKLETGPALKSIRTAPRGDRRTLDQLYLTALSRRPTPEEACIATEYTVPDDPKQTPDKYWNDIAWALINSDEFLFRH